MTTLEVRAIANEVVSTYDEKTGLPRHTQNLDNFKTVFEWMAKLNTGIKIGTVVGAFLVGLPAVIASIITIVRFLKELK